ncbi:MAG TPA: metallophosphoesterase family protein [Pirellulales bacterium]|jgi:hypothetical protein
MPNFDRRRFLQAGSLLLAGGYVQIAFGDDAGPAPAFAAQPTFEPTALFLTWQRDPTTSMTMQWIGSEKEGADRPIWFSQAGSNLWRQKAGSPRQYPMTEKWIHRTELTGLTPDTEYVFRVGLDSPELRFRTMPAKATNTIHFVSGGDAGTGTHPVQTNRVAAVQAPQFVVIGGDLAYENGKSPDTFLEFLKNYSRDLRSDRQQLIPMLACIGNHEVNGGYGKSRKEAPFFYAMFDGLFSDSGYASLDFGDYLSLVLLDTNHTTPIEGAQTDWLAKTLKDREECPTVFVFNHVPAYPSFRPIGLDFAGDLGTGTGNRKLWAPLFERYNVDAVFEHHDHTYKRTHPLLDGHTNKNGIVYLGDGSWGKIRKPAKPEARPYLAVTDEAYHLSVHRIEGDQRFHVALSDTGRVVDICSTTKRARTGSRA